MQDRKNKIDAAGGYIAWLKDRVDVYGYVFNGFWFDIGDYKYLNAAKEKFAN
jgi:NDP-sugar pyrophosphorylase family protein